MSPLGSHVSLWSEGAAPDGNLFIEHDTPNTICLVI